MIAGIQNAPNVVYVVTGEQLHQFGNECANVAVQRAVQQLNSKIEYLHGRMFDKRDVADMFNVTLRTIDNWIKAGIVHTTTIGNVVRIDGDEINRIKTNYKQIH